MIADDYFSMLHTMHSAEVGDELEIISPSRHHEVVKPRRVVVTGHVPGSSDLLLSSGRVRPGHRAFGVLKDWGDSIGYQPTIQQQIREVSSLRITRRAGSRN